MPAVLPNLEPFIQAGINPKTGLPSRIPNGNSSKLKEDIRRVLRMNDEQICINRFKWNNLPREIDKNLIERVLYYRGQGAFFKMETLNKFFFLPYALDGEIDVYGRFTGITPLPFNGQMGANEKEMKPWIRGLIRKPIYYEFDEKENNVHDVCVLLSDYAKQLSQTVLPRQQLNEGIIDVESDCIPFLRTALLNSTGIQGMKVGNQDEYAAVAQASNSINEAALKGMKYVPIIGSIDFQELTGGTVGKAEEFLQTMQSLDNFRLSTIGLSNGGLFQKKAHMLQDEQDMNAGGGTNLIMEDGLTLRQQFCDLVNSVPEWNLNLSVEAVESDNDGTNDFEDTSKDVNKENETSQEATDE